MSECSRLADQLRRAFEGNAWHGDSLVEILADVDAKTAAAHTIKNAHSIWELVLHIAAWDGSVLKRAGGSAGKVSSKQNFPLIKDKSEAAWREAVQHTITVHYELVKAVAAFPDSRLMERVPGKTAKHHTFFYNFSGIVQHELYHAGQIALLKKAVK